jgi:hypothetical protein
VPASDAHVRRTPTRGYPSQARCLAQRRTWLVQATPVLFLSWWSSRSLTAHLATILTRRVLVAEQGPMTWTSSRGTGLDVILFESSASPSASVPIGPNTCGVSPSCLHSPEKLQAINGECSLRPGVVSGRGGIARSGCSVEPRTGEGGLMSLPRLPPRPAGATLRLMSSTQRQKPSQRPAQRRAPRPSSWRIDCVIDSEHALRRSAA